MAKLDADKMYQYMEQALMAQIKERVEDELVAKFMNELEPRIRAQVKEVTEGLTLATIERTRSLCTLQDQFEVTFKWETEPKPRKENSIL